MKPLNIECSNCPKDMKPILPVLLTLLLLGAGCRDQTAEKKIAALEDRVFRLETNRIADMDREFEIHAQIRELMMATNTLDKMIITNRLEQTDMDEGFLRAFSNIQYQIRLITGVPKK